jgi:hypothetical protein
MRSRRMRSIRGGTPLTRSAIAEPTFPRGGGSSDRPQAPTRRGVEQMDGARID